MKDIYAEALEAFNKKEFVKALKLFSSIDFEDSKSYENKCIDNLEDIIYYSKRKNAKNLLSQLTFYKDYGYFVDAYKRKNTNLVAKILMFGCAIIATVILILVML